MTDIKEKRKDYLAGGIIMGAFSVAIIVILLVYQFRLPEGEYVDGFSLSLALPVICILVVLSFGLFRKATNIRKQK